ncbi:MAG: amidase [Myxococcota bacterium]
MSELAYKTAIELAQMIRDKKISSVELTEHFIGRIEKWDGDINAVVVRDFECAREAARQADASPAEAGPLHGVPMTIKEAYDIENLPTTWGYPVMKDNRAASDAVAVQKFKAAGAIFIGKTNVPISLADFQSYNEVYGTTGNPWNPDRTPGGSSGGSAAALAAGLSPLEAGSDIGGSIRTPAHYCGVYGHKPTWGVVPPQGHALPGVVATPDLAVCGPLARNAEDLALALDVMSGAAPLDEPGWRLELPKPQKTSLSEFRVAIWPTDENCPVDSEIADRATALGETLSKLGATVSDSARPDFDPAASHVTYQTLLNSIMGASLSADQRAAAQAVADASDPGDLSSATVMARGAVLSHRLWLVHNNVRERLRYRWREFFEDWDILICPQASTPAFPHDHSPMHQRTLRVNGVDQMYFQQLFWAGIATAAYLPSTVFPTGPSSEGLPIGLQAVGCEYSDLHTIDFTRLLEREIGGFQRPPGFA